MSCLSVQPRQAAIKKNQKCDKETSKSATRVKDLKSSKDTKAERHLPKQSAQTSRGNKTALKRGIRNLN